MDNLAKIKKRQALDRLLKSAKPKAPEPSKEKNNKVVESAFRVFTHAAGQEDADSAFLEDLRKLTGQDSVQTMLERFRKLAGLD